MVQNEPTLGKVDPLRISTSDPEVLGKVDRLDRRRQAQIQNQINVINGLKKQLEAAKQEIHSQKVIIYVLLQRLGGEQALRRADLVRAPGDAVLIHPDADDNGFRLQIKENNV